MSLVWTGTTTDNPDRREADCGSFAELCYRTWPDLPNTAKLVVLPREDFVVIMEALAGRPALPVRHGLAIEIRRRRESVVEKQLRENLGRWPNLEEFIACRGRPLGFWERLWRRLGR